MGGKLKLRPLLPWIVQGREEKKGPVHLEGNSSYNVGLQEHKKIQKADERFRNGLKGKVDTLGRQK